MVVALLLVPRLIDGSGAAPLPVWSCLILQRRPLLLRFWLKLRFSSHLGSLRQFDSTVLAVPMAAVPMAAVCRWLHCRWPKRRFLGAIRGFPQPRVGIWTLDFCRFSAIISRHLLCWRSIRKTPQSAIAAIAALSLRLTYHQQQQQSHLQH